MSSWESENFPHFLLFVLNQSFTGTQICNVYVYGENALAELSARDWYAKENFDLEGSPRSDV